MSATNEASTITPIEAIEACYARGWTDGLPVVPPTVERLEQFLAAAGRAPDEVLGTVRERNQTVTVEKAALNAIMAGCLPEYFPVVLAALEAMLDPAWNLHAMCATTSGPAALVMVHGPLARELGFNAGANLFGPGFRANATVGRAIRLVLLNVLGAKPGVMDMATFGHPGKYTCCIAEDEEAFPQWNPLHVELGLDREASAVTVLASGSPAIAVNSHSNDPEGILATVADVVMSSANGTLREGAFLVILGPEHAEVVVRAGWSKAEVRRFLAERATRPLAELKRAGHLAGAIQPGDETRLVPAVASPDQLYVLVAGGGGGVFSAVVRPWGWGHSPVTRLVDRPAGSSR